MKVKNLIVSFLVAIFLASCAGQNGNGFLKTLRLKYSKDTQYEEFFKQYYKKWRNTDMSQKYKGFFHVADFPVTAFAMSEPLSDTTSGIKYIVDNSSYYYTHLKTKKGKQYLYVNKKEFEKIAHDIRNIKNHGAGVSLIVTDIKEENGEIYYYCDLDFRFGFNVSNLNSKDKDTMCRVTFNNNKEKEEAVAEANKLNIDNVFNKPGFGHFEFVGKKSYSVNKIYFYANDIGFDEHGNSIYATYNKMCDIKEDHIVYKLRVNFNQIFYKDLNELNKYRYRKIKNMSDVYKKGDWGQTYKINDYIIKSFLLTSQLLLKNNDIGARKQLIKLKTNKKSKQYFYLLNYNKKVKAAVYLIVADNYNYDVFTKEIAYLVNTKKLKKAYCYEVSHYVFADFLDVLYSFKHFKVPENFYSDVKMNWKIGQILIVFYN